MFQNQKNFTKEPFKLLKNISYPTYQLYAAIENKELTTENILKICMLEALSWLRKRFREFDTPDEINVPEPEHYQEIDLSEFKSFRINEGYIVEVVFIKELGLWALHLVEPDLGSVPGSENQRRQPVAGRVFETNIAFIIKNDNVECGIKIVCAEPIAVNNTCEVYRPALVKQIVRNKLLSLRQVKPIIEKPYYIDTVDKVMELKDFISSYKRQLPIVIAVEKLCAQKINIKPINSKEFANNYVNSLTLAKLPTEKLAEINSASKHDKIIKYELPIDINLMAKFKMGYSHFYILKYDLIECYNNAIAEELKLLAGDLRIIYPVKFNNEAKCFSYEYINENRAMLEVYLNEIIQNYPKNKQIDYENVKFIDEAMIIQQNSLIEKSNSSKTIIRAFNREIESINNINKQKLQEYENELRERDKTIDIANNRIAFLESKLEEHQNEKDTLRLSYENKINELTMELTRKDAHIARPTKTTEVSDWVEKHFKDKLIFHDKAKDLIKKVPNSEINMSILCDALEFLANEYRDELLNKIDREQRNKLCSSKYKRPFDVAPSGDMSIKRYPNEYKIKYYIGYNGKPIESNLDLHLRIGNDNENLLRIYFLYDKEKKLIVVGSLPRHLNTMSEKSS